MRRDPDKLRAWQQRSAEKAQANAREKAMQEGRYSSMQASREKAFARRKKPSNRHAAEIISAADNRTYPVVRRTDSKRAAPVFAPPRTALTTITNQTSEMATNKVGAPEVWRAVLGYGGLYEASDQGRIRSLDRDVLFKDGRTRRFRGRVLAPQLNKDGRMYVGLSRNGKGKTWKVHHLVLRSFVGPRPTSGHECNHINGVPTDNRLRNLEWVTKERNQEHARQNGLYSSGKGSSLRSTDVIAIREARSAGASIDDLASRYGLRRGHIYEVVVGKKWKRVGGPLQEMTGIYGSHNHGAVLSEAQVRDIYFREYPSGLSMTALGRKYGVDCGTISNIVSGSGWVAVTGGEDIRRK